ncbi:MAG: acyl-CoA reductase [Candidatus Margulisiibacteriota bacterium]
MNILSPPNISITMIQESPVTRPFDPTTIDFFSNLSDHLFTEQKFQAFPELIALAFWLRKGNLQKLQRNLEPTQDTFFLARGIVFHIAPSNVDTIFIYSWVISALVGNKNILRVSSKKSTQMDLLINALNHLEKDPKFTAFCKRYMIISYPHDTQTTEALSAICDMRAIWGGDQTISTIRSCKLPAHAKEIVFSDKFSACAIQAKNYCIEKNTEDLISKFIADTYFFDQLGCSSPKLVYWVGTPSDCTEAKTKFWKALHSKLTTQNRDISSSGVLSKLATTHTLAINNPTFKVVEQTNTVVRLAFNSISDIDRERHCGEGLFYEVESPSLADLFIHSTPKDQTLTLFGFSKEDILNTIKNHPPRGFSRFVPIGTALDFHIHWDGYNLLREFSREIVLNPQFFKKSDP